MRPVLCARCNKKPIRRWRPIQGPRCPGPLGSTRCAQASAPLAVAPRVVKIEAASAEQRPSGGVLSDMRVPSTVLSDQFLDEELAAALRYLPPHERRVLHRSAMAEWADERGHERTVMISVRVPVSLAVRVHVERGRLKRRLGRRRLNFSDAVRLLLCDALATQTETEAVVSEAEPVEVPQQRAA